MVSVDDLEACGLNHTAIDVRRRRGQLHRIHHGVYAVGHSGISLKGRFIAAVKACGPRATLSHLAALADLELLGWDETWPVDVTVAGDSLRRHRGLRVHRTRWLERRDVWIRQGIPVTAPARSILDSAALLPERRLRRVVRQALADGRVTVRQLADVLARGGSRRGSGRLARVLADAEPTRSELEDVVLDMIVAAGFRPPLVNVPLRIAGRLVIPDFRWPEERLIVEADGRRWHDDPLARADDLERQVLLEAHGERVERVTWKQAVGERRRTQARLAEAGAPRTASE